MTHEGSAGNIFCSERAPCWSFFATVGQDLEAQTIAAVDAVMVDLPKNQGVFGQQLITRV